MRIAYNRFQYAPLSGLALQKELWAFLHFLFFHFAAIIIYSRYLINSYLNLLLMHLKPHLRYFVIVKLSFHQLFGRPQWFTVRWRSQAYVKKVSALFTMLFNQIFHKQDINYLRILILCSNEW